MKTLLGFFLLLSCKCHYSQHVNLFPIIENELWGYMNADGKTIIKPQFRVANWFSEDLAAVRINGKYGYINKTGETVIDPVFDFATSFHNGHAIAYTNGIPQVIKKDGRPLFNNNYPGLLMISRNRFVVTTENKRQGIVNDNGEWILDTNYIEIIPTENSLYIVREKRPKDSDWDLIGILDEKKKYIVPYNIYRNISGFHHGLARIQKISKNGKGDYEGFIDLKGQLVFKIADKKIWQVGDFDGDFAKASLSSGKGVSSERLYEGYIDRNGKLVIDNKDFDEVYPFAENRALVQNHDDGYYFINRGGKRINKMPYDKVVGGGFQNGIAIVRIENEWQIIDSNMNVLWKKHIESDEVKYADSILFFYNEETEKWSFWDLEKDKKPGISFDYFDQSGFNNNLLLVQDELKLSYIDKDGRIIWQQIIDTNKVLPLNIDYMKRGYYYAYSVPVESELKYGGWGRSSNLPRNDSEYDWIQSNKLNFYRSTDDTTLYTNTAAKKLFIFNATTDTIFFPAQDSRLYIKIQALNEQGSWRDIEYLPSSWCGNSYHTLLLAPGEHWKFASPLYEGDFKTKLRAELKYQIGPDKGSNTKYVFVYSNEFAGSINPGQFWRKQEYTPSGLMDPYYD